MTQRWLGNPGTKSMVNRVFGEKIEQLRSDLWSQAGAPYFVKLVYKSNRIFARYIWS